MSSLIDTLTDFAQRAGIITLHYFQTQLAVESKADASPVTIADRRTEDFLRKEIAKRFPFDLVVGEEYGRGEGSGRRTWIIDPIDGTKAFIHGVPIYGVMIGVEEEGEVIAGVVNMPALRELVVAEKGEGCWWNGKPASVSGVNRLDESLLVTTDVASNAKYGKGEAWDRLAGRAKLVRTWGDCYGHLLVATGRAEIAVDPHMNPWDCAALKPILEEAGGTFTDYAGTPTIYADGAISTNGHVSEEVLELVKNSSGVGFQA